MDGNEIIAGELLVSVVGAEDYWSSQPAVLVFVTCNNYYGWLYVSNTVDGACCPKKNKKNNRLIIKRLHDKVLVKTGSQLR